MPGLFSSSSVAVLGVPFDNVTMDEAISTIEQNIEDGGFHQIATANVDFLVHAIRDRKLQQILCSCSLVVPDGMPIIWAARLMGVKLKQRVSGVDLMPRVAELAVRRGYRIFLLGASEKSSQRAAEVLQEKYPGLRIVGRYSPPLQPLEDMNHEDILRRVAQAKPDILLVAFGNPKQEKWLSMHRDRLNVPVCIGIGGSLDLIAGRLARAPRWMQDCGLEWFYRVCQEPKRLAGRYLNDALSLGKHLPQQVAANATQPRTNGFSKILARQVGNTEVISVMGDLTGLQIAEFEMLARNARASGRDIVMDLAKGAYFGPDSIGSLMQLLNSMQRSRLQLWLAGSRPHLIRLLRVSKLEHHFNITSTVSDALYRIAKSHQRTLAPVTSVQMLGQRAVGAVQVRRETLQDVCQTMTAVNDGSNLDMAVGFGSTHRYGFDLRTYVTHRRGDRTASM